jgi:hypothetical protein
MAIESLSAKEQHIVLQCMKATAAHVEDSEKHSRLGVEADALQKEIARWPSIDDRVESSAGFLAINNSMNEVCNGFKLSSTEWSTWFDTTRDEVDLIYRKWLALKQTRGGLR